MRRIGLALLLVGLLVAGLSVASWLRAPQRASGVASRHVHDPARSEPDETAAEGVEIDSSDVLRAEAEVAESAAAAEDTPSEAGIRLRVIDEADAPIAGARVGVHERADFPEQTTDSDGRCRLSAELDAEEGLFVTVEAEGYFPLRQFLFQGDEHELRLHRPARLSGRVLEADTRLPIAGARVKVAWKADDGEARAVLSDSAGRFADLLVPAGATCHVRASAAGYLDRDRRSGALLVSSQARDPHTEILLERARVGEFLVADSESGEPVAGATLYSGLATYTADDRGRVSVDRSLRTTDASYTLNVDARGHCRTWFEVQDLGSPDEPVELRLPRACSIAGTLRDARGEPLAGVTIAARLSSEDGQELRRTGRLPESADSARWPANASWVRSMPRDRLDASKQGRFELDGLPPGLARIELELSGESRVLARREVGPLGPPGSRLQVDWQLEPFVGGGLHGRLLVQGEPHAGYVTWTRRRMEGTTIVGTDGAFAFEGLEPGELELTGHAFSMEAQWGTLGYAKAPVVVVAGQTQLVDLDVRTEVGTIGGSLRDAHGSALPGVEITLWNQEDQANFSCVSADDGSWSVRVADIPRPYRVHSLRPLREEGLEVRAGTEGLELHEIASGRLRYRALDSASGAAIPAVLLALRAPDGEARTLGSTAQAAPDTTGWTEIELPEGDHQLAAWTSDRSHRGSARSIRITAGEVSEVEFRLDPSEVLTLRLQAGAAPLPDQHLLLLLGEAEWELVTLMPGAGLPRLSYAALPFDPGRPRELFLRPGRAHTLRGLAPGRHRFKVFPDDVRIEPEWIDVPAAGVVEVSWAPKP